MKFYRKKIKLLSSIIVSCISTLGFSQTQPTPKFHDTQGNIEVTQAGQLQYTLIVDLPPGVKKTAPNISLVYVSGAGNGLAGYGWNISGVTSISRVGKNLEKDGITKGVQLDYSDYYSFNGQRLILKSGEYGKDGAEYVTEKYSTAKIKSVGAVAGQTWQGPEYWEVTFDDGSQAWYGAAASGNSQARTPIDYNIVKSKDTNGNYITYNYISAGNVSVINSVEWGGNETKNTPHFNKIDFVFGARPKSETAYIKAVEFSQSKMLESIVVSTGGKQYKKYNISYKKDLYETPYRYVDKVTVLNSKNEEANPVSFTYEKSLLGDTYWGYMPAIRPNSDHDVTGDFNGDGRLDVLRYHSTTDSNIPQVGVYLYSNFYSSFVTSQVPLFVGNSLSELKDAIAINVKKNDVIYNRQGFVTKKKISLPSSYKSDLQLNFYTLNENNTLSGFSKTIPSNNYDKTEGEFNPYLPGFVTNTIPDKMINIDLNGDGLSEVILELKDEKCYRTIAPAPDDPTMPYPVYDCNTTRRYLLIQPNDDTSDFYSELDFNQPNKDIFKEYRMGDFNGDGLIDMLGIDQNQKPQLITFQKNTQGKYYANVAPFNPANDETIKGYWEDSLAGDFNGDGLSDIMMPGTKTAAIWYLYTSKGNSFKEEAPVFYRPERERRVTRDINENIRILNPNTFVAYDINNDGKTELIMLESGRYYSKAGVQDSNQGVKYTRNYSITAKVFSALGGEQMAIQKALHPAETIYLNGSSINQELAPNSKDMIGISVDHWTGSMLREFVLASAMEHNSGLNNQQYFSSHRYIDIAREARIKTISQGGVTTEVTYKQLEKDQYRQVYDEVKTESYPYVEISQAIGMYVVSKMTKTTTSAEVLEQNFNYRGLTSNILGRGMIGFRKTARTSWYGRGFESTRIWSGVEIDPTNDGIPVKEWSIKANYEAAKIFPADVSENNTELLSFKSTAYQIDKLLNGQKVTTVSDADKARVVTAIVPKTIRTKDFLKGIITENTINYGEYYLPSVSTTSVNGNFGVTTKKINYANNPSGQGKDYYIGRVTANVEEKKAYSDTQKIAEFYTYENNLLKTIVTIAGTDFDRAVQDEFTYDGFGNIVQKLTTTGYDTSTRSEKSEYDAKGRSVIKRTNHLGLETVITYNDWGQVQTQTDPFGNVLSHFYDDWGKLGITTSNLDGVTNYTYERDSNYNAIFTQFDSDGDVTKTFTNKLGQVYKTSAKAFGDGKFASKEIQYDLVGRKIKESEPYFEGQTADRWNTIAYDDSVLPAKIKATAFTGKQTETTISGLTTTEKESSTADYGRTKSETTDALGNIISTTDKGGTVLFSYNAAGKQTQAKYAENTVTTKYDSWGRKSEFNDPSNGIYKYEYDGLGKTKKITSPKGFKEFTYDNLGQLISQKEFSTIDAGQTTNKTISFTYSSKGLLTEKSGILKGQALSSKYTYDPKGRLLSFSENSNGRTYTHKGITYNNQGKIASYEKELQSSGILTKVIVENIYSPWNGELYQIKDKTSGKVLWEQQQTNARGQVIKAKLGAAEVSNTYNDAMGLLQETKHWSTVQQPILNIQYTFNAVRNELKFRKTIGDIPVEEFFDYDDNNRLVNWTNPVTGIKPVPNRNVYDVKGRIIENDQVGTMKYENSAKIYQPTGMTLNAVGTQNYNGDLIQSIVYNENNDPVKINGEKTRIDFDYGLGNMRQRVGISKLKNPPGGGSTELKMAGAGVWDPNAPLWQSALTKLYNEDGSFEVTLDLTTGQEKHVLYIGGTPYESNIVYLKDFGQSNGSYKFLHKDYIGSILAISDEEGNKVEQRHYDAWGNLTHLKIGNAPVITDKETINGSTLLIDRGYTGHEHFMEVGIIHMNGRLYDPLLRRFLSADENIQDPANTQNYNKYGYVMNNPLMYNDPDGEFWLWFAGALVGGYLNGVQANNGNWNPGKWDWQKSWSAVLGGAIGGAAISGTLGNIASNPGAIKSFLPGIVSGGLNSAFTGSNFLSGAIGGISYKANLFENRVTTTRIANNGYKYIISPNYNDDGESFGNNPEEPVGFFGPTDDPIFHTVFKQQHDIFKNTKGDGIFRVYSHGNFGTLFNGEELVNDAKTFDAVMNSKNSNWKNVDKMKDPILILYACLSGVTTTVNVAIGKQISKAHPNLTVIAFNGFVTYDTRLNGIKNINVGLGKNDGNGAIVFFQNGKYLTGYKYKQFLQKYPDFK